MQTHLRRTLTIPRTLYDCLKGLTQEDNNAILNCILALMFDGEDLTTSLSPFQKTVFLLLSPITNKMFAQFNNGVSL